MNQLYNTPALDKNGVEVHAKDCVRVPKGTMVRSTHPKFRQDGIQESAGARTVKVHRIARHTSGKHEVCWAGQGQYWFYCMAEDVEKVEL